MPLSSWIVAPKLKGVITKQNLPLSRREFLTGSGVLMGTIMAGSIFATLAPSPVWAVELKTLSEAEGETLLKEGIAALDKAGFDKSDEAAKLAAVKRAELDAAKYECTPVKEFKRGDELLARFFFIQDPDGYKIEMLERHGHYV
jgi:hypothetical protein